MDDKIQQLTKKKGLLEQYKKGVMQQIFSQQLRFKDDNGNDYQAWQTKKLGEVLEYTTSNMQENQIQNNNTGNYPVYGASGFIKNIGSYLMDKNYIGIVKDGTGVGRILLCSKYSSVLSTLGVLTSSHNSIKYLYYLIKTINLDTYKVGSTIPHIYFKDYSQHQVLIPEYGEQTKIADFLTSIDDKITQVTAMLTQIQQYKKSLLQQMFI